MAIRAWRRVRLNHILLSDGDGGHKVGMIYAEVIFTNREEASLLSIGIYNPELARPADI